MSTKHGYILKQKSDYAGMVRLCLLLVCAALIFTLSGCAGSAAVPGGDNETNRALLQSRDAFLGKMSMIRGGMHASQVAQILGESQKKLILLNRAQVVDELFGGNHIGLAQSFSSRGEYMNYVQSLAGYKLYYVDHDKEHGFVNPIRFKTQKRGFEYEVTFIFEHDYLLEDPIIAGGRIDRSKSTTLFDVIDPGRLANQAF